MTGLASIPVNVQLSSAAGTTSEREEQEDCGRGHACQFCPLDDNCSLDRNAHHQQLMQHKLANIEQIVMVMANKGGVGKSTVAANLAASLAAQGHRVGVADADIHGPNQSRFFGQIGRHVRVTGDGLQTCQFEHTACAHPICVASLAFLNQRDDAPVVWRDAYKHDFIHHLMGSFAWPELDYLIVDMPPGTGNELITLCDLLEGSEVVSLLVTTPQSVALMDTMKMATFCRERGMPVLGVIENMAGVTCPHCDEEFQLFPREALDEALNAARLETLAQLPLTPALARASDDGNPLALELSSGKVHDALTTVAQRCTAHVRARRGEINAEKLDEILRLNMEDDALKAALDTLEPDSRNATAQQIRDLLGAESSRAGAATLTDRAVNTDPADARSV